MALSIRLIVAVLSPDASAAAAMDFQVSRPCSKWVTTSAALTMSPILLGLAVVWWRVRQRPARIAKSAFAQTAHAAE